MYSFIRRCSTTILSNLEIRLSVRYPGVVTKRPKRLTHYPTVNTLSNGLHTIQMLTHYPITDPWVTRPERPKDEVKILQTRILCFIVNKEINSNIWFVKQFNFCAYIGGKCRSHRSNDPPIYVAPNIPNSLLPEYFGRRYFV